MLQPIRWEPVVCVSCHVSCLPLNTYSPQNHLLLVAHGCPIQHHLSMWTFMWMNPMGPQWKSSWPSPAAITELRFCFFCWTCWCRGISDFEDFKWSWVKMLWKKLNMAWKIKGAYRRSTLQQRSCCEMSGGNWLFSNDRKLWFNYQWLRFHHGKCELKGNMAVTPHTWRCFPARRVQKGAAMVFTDQHGSIAATIPEYINWSTVGFAQCQEQCPLTDRKMGVINVKLKLHGIGWIPHIIEV